MKPFGSCHYNNELNPNSNSFWAHISREKFEPSEGCQEICACNRSCEEFTEMSVSGVVSSLTIGYVEALLETF